MFNSININGPLKTEINNNNTNNNVQLLAAPPSNYLTPNTISVHADTSVTVTRWSRSPSIRSRTSVSLMINGESIETSTLLG